MPAVIEYCLRNVDEEIEQSLDACHVPTRSLACMEQCGICYREPFFVVDGEFVDGSSHASLLDEILERNDQA